MYPDNDYRNYLAHSQAGTHWKKGHKYIAIKNGRYIYPGDIKGMGGKVASAVSNKVSAGVNAVKNVVGSSKSSGVSSTVTRTSNAMSSVKDKKLSSFGTSKKKTFGKQDTKSGSTIGSKLKDSYKKALNWTKRTAHNIKDAPDVARQKASAGLSRAARNATKGIREQKRQIQLKRARKDISKIAQTYNSPVLKTLGIKAADRYRLQGRATKKNRNRG